MEKIQNHKSQIFRGLIILALGVYFLLPTLGIYIPKWVFGWHTFILIMGLYLGVKRNFNGIGWLIMVLLGAFLYLDAIPDFDFNLSKYGLGLGLIILGGYIILRPKNRFKRNRFSSSFRSSRNPIDQNFSSAETETPILNSNDVIDVISVFGGSHQTVYSKNFKGGDITAVFGGADINFVQADFADTVSLDVTAIFGGIKLVVPQGWAIKSNVTAVFGSVEDKRAQVNLNTDAPVKTLVLDGSAFFGGIEIKSY